MRYVVDGYNVTKQDPATAALDLEGQREALVARLATRGADLLGRGTIVVVFDGVEGGGADYRRGPVLVSFSRAGKADGLIVSLAGPDTTVVTSDVELSARVRERKASVLPSERVFEGARRAPRTPKRPAPIDDGLPHGHRRVTEELKRIWLGEEE